MTPEIIVSAASGVISLLALVIAYMADRRSKRNADVATQLSFQTKKNEIAVAVAELRNANQGHVQQVLRAIEEFREVSEQVEALAIPQLSEQASEFRIDLVQFFQEVESPEVGSVMQEISEELSKLPAERATSTARIRLEAVYGMVQQLETLSKQQEAAATSTVSSIRKATGFYRENIIKRAEEEGTVE